MFEIVFLLSVQDKKKIKYKEKPKFQLTSYCAQSYLIWTESTRTNNTLSSKLIPRSPLFSRT